MNPDKCMVITYSDPECPGTWYPLEVLMGEDTLAAADHCDELTARSRKERGVNYLSYTFTVVPVSQ